MHPQDEHPQTEQPQTKHRVDPTASSKSLAIALVVAAAFLLAAAGIIVWLVFGNKPSSTVTNKPADDVASVKNVSFVVPPDLPANYVRNDQSKTGSTTIFYYDDATNCGFTLGIAPVPADKPVKGVVTDALAAAATQGVATTTKIDGAKVDLKDSASGKAYTFDAIDAEQTVDVPAVNFTKQNNTILYKQFGAQIASLGYACKAEVWAEKKVELATWAQKFTVKTER
jgi:hypothetical protein